MRWTWFARVLGLCWLVPVLVRAEAPALPPSTQRYDISASLDPAKHTVRGRMKLTVLNTSARPLEELVFHLYLNAFRDQKSVFMRESGGAMRGERFRGAGSITLASLRVDGVDLLARAETELVAGDRTQLRVHLSTPVAVGKSVAIESEFTSQLPPVFARSGYAGHFFAVTQWFPKLAKLEPDGDFTSFPYHAQGEFYADFADYSLHLDTPADFVVGATGQLSGEAKKGARVERRFEAKHVLDAAWVASPWLVEQRERMGDVEVRFLLPAGYDRALSEHVEIVRAGLAHFGARFGPYPYPVLTVVLPPRGASGAGGMEYPTLIMTEGTWLPTPGSPGLSGAFVTAHELAHEWFYGILASNEVRYPVLDEGFAEWASLDLLRTQYGRTNAFSRFFGFDRFELERMSAVARAPAPPGLAAYAFAAREYGASVYAYAATALESIRRAYGRARFDAALAAYARANRFGHPTPTDLARSFDAVYGAGFAQSTLLPLLMRGDTSRVHIVEARAHEQKKRFRTRVRARRQGHVALPTWLAAYGENGKEIDRVRWPSGTEALDVTFDTGVRVARVVADPDRALLVDDDARDQVVVLARSPSPSLTTRVVGLFQMLLSWVGP